MHFRCIDYLPPKQREFKHICSKHTQKICLCNPKKTLNNSTVQLGHTLPLPRWKGAVCWISAAALASFPQAPVRNAKPRQLLFGTNNVPLPVHLKTQKPRHCCSQTLPDLLHWREERKAALCLLQCLVCMEEMVPSCLGPRSRPGAAGALLVTQSLPSVPCNSGKLHFRAPFSPLSSEKISADLTEALTCNASTGQGPFRGGEAGFQLRSSL